MSGKLTHTSILGSGRRRFALVFCLLAGASIGLVLISRHRNPDSRNALSVSPKEMESHSSRAFVISNRSVFPLLYSSCIEVKAGADWPVYPVGSPLPHPPLEQLIGPHASEVIIVDRPDAREWRLSVLFIAATNEPILLKARELLERTGFKSVANWIPNHRRIYTVLAEPLPERTATREPKQK